MKKLCKTIHIEGGRFAAILTALALTVAMIASVATIAFAESTIEQGAVGLSPGGHATGTLEANGIDSYRVELLQSGILTVGVNTLGSLTDANVSILTSTLQQAPGSPATSWRLPLSATLYLDEGVYFVTIASKGSGSTQTGEYAIALDFELGYRVSAQSESSTHGTASAVAYAASDSVVEINAYPATGFIFDQWVVTSRKEVEVALPGETPYTRVENNAIIANRFSASTTFTFPAKTLESIPGDVVIMAKFKGAHTVTLTQSTGGTAYAGKTTAAAGESVTLTATPTSGYSFDRWLVTQGGITIASPTSPSTSFTMPDGNVTITAQYKKQIQITAPATITGGTVRADRYTAYSGENVSIYATTESNYAFDKWNVTGGTVADPYAESTWVTVGDTQVTLSAAFIKKDPATTYYTITAASNNTAYGRASASPASALKDATVTITATPVSGSVFDRWTVISGGAVLANPTSASTTFKMPESNVRVQAIFTRTSTSTGSTLDLISGNSTMGSVSADTLTAKQGEVVHIRAIPKIGHNFTGWQVINSGGATIASSSSPDTTLTMGSGDTTVRANFAQSSGYTSTAWQDYAAILNAERAFASSADMAKRLSSAAATGSVSQSQYPIVLIKDASAGSYYTDGAIDSAHSGAIAAISSEYGEVAELAYTTSAGRATVNVYIYKRATTADIEAVNNSLLTALLHGSALQDVAQSASNWAKDDINYANSLSLVPDELLSAYQRNITREEYCRIAVRVLMAARGYADDLNGFMRANSVDQNHKFSDTSDIYVTIAYSLGVVNGVGDNKYNPNSSITRQEAAVMASRAADVLGAKTSGAYVTFADAASIASWAKAGVDFASASGIMLGTGSSMFSPLGIYTREQAIVTLLRLYRL